MHKLGYPCINITLQESQKIYTNRHMIKRTFDSQRQTLEGVSKLALENVKDLVKIIQWNERKGIRFFRISSNMFPWMSEYEITDLPNWPLISANLKLAGKLSQDYGHRLEFHPGPFNVLASTNSFVVKKTIKELDQHAQIFDEMGLSPSHWNPINIHINTTQGGKSDAAKRFCDGFQKLKSSTKERLVIENDDKPSQYSVLDIYEMVYREISTPITFDVHHHKFCNSALDHETAAKLAASTWGDVAAGFHFASTINHESPNQMARAHAEWIYDEISDYGTGAWMMCECKGKELAILDYLENGPKSTEYQEKFQLITS